MVRAGIRWFASLRVRFRYALPGLAFLVAIVIPLALYGCSGEQQVQGGEDGLNPYTEPNPKAIASAVFPSYVIPKVGDAYEFALARPDVLRYMPCYCGCGITVDHISNLDCFIQGIESDGTVRFDSHGHVCMTCLDIARDARRLLGEGKSLPEIRGYVDETYRQRGPGTDTPWPPA